MQELENFKKELLTIDLVRANVFGILILFPIVLIFGLPYYLLWNPDINVKVFIETVEPQEAMSRMLFTVGFLLIGIVVHELIHGITWARFAHSGFKSIKFGVLWKMLTPYCHCKEPLKVKHYFWGAITPALVLGFIPSIVAIFIGNLGMLIFGIFFTMAAGGDFLIINLIRKENMDALVLDHPSEAGCYIYRKL